MLPGQQETGYGNFTGLIQFAGRERYLTEQVHTQYRDSFAHYGLTELDTEFGDESAPLTSKKDHEMYFFSIQVWNRFYFFVGDFSTLKT